MTCQDGFLIQPFEACRASCSKTCCIFAVQDSTLNRFLWVLSYFAKRGFYVVLVHQTNTDGIAAASPAQWLQSWRWLMQ